MTNTNTAHRTALIVGHAQQPITLMPDDPKDYLKRLADCIAAARAANVPVIYAQLSFSEGYPELLESSVTKGIIAPPALFLESKSDAIDPAVEPQAGDIVVPCSRISAFAYSKLEPILRALGVETLALAGISTGGVILGTLVDARNRDFGVVVLEDLCYQPGEAQNSLLAAFRDPWHATVCNSKHWLEGLAAS
ncbi:cysteine hydrolase family protein [Pseudomonas sp. H11T01]|uniref:cysteine hydrolase family protein n=1 Tax=Pseudomonas sp. H11T01 TaxID=3402749 RepID=UPI003AD19019